MLVIFDCDGVLVDSENVSAEVFSALLAEINLTVSAAQCLQNFRGLTLADCSKWLEREWRCRLPPDFTARLEQATLEAFCERLQPVKGVMEVLDHLQQSFTPFCVASNGGLKKIQHALRVTGLDRYFSGNCFSAEFVDEGKPSPALFRYAAESMGVPPEFCTVVEDSAAGVAAATAAGMRVFYYCPEEATVEVSRPPEGVTASFTTMQALPALLRAV